jgi:cell division protein FtsB
MNQRKWVWWAIAAAGVLAAVSAADAGGFRHYLKLEQEISALGERNRRLSEENQALRREVEALSKDPEALERAAREELNFIKPGEIVLHLE